MITIFKLSPRRVHIEYAGDDRDTDAVLLSACAVLPQYKSFSVMPATWWLVPCSHCANAREPLGGSSRAGRCLCTCFLCFFPMIVSAHSSKRSSSQPSMDAWLRKDSRASCVSIVSSSTCASGARTRTRTPGRAAQVASLAAGNPDPRPTGTAVTFPRLGLGPVPVVTGWTDLGPQMAV